MIARLLLTAVCALVAGAMIERAHVDAAVPSTDATIMISKHG